MNTDIRLLLSFRSHPKTKKLRLKLGEAGPLGFIYLLMFAAESKPDGVLDGMDKLDVAIAADYREDPDEFVDALVAFRLLDFDGETYSIHDWTENNPYAAGASDRRKHARKAAEARWKKEKGRTIDPPTKKQTLTSKNHAPSMPEQCGEHANSMQGAQKGNAPSPSPSPSPLPDPPLETLSQDSPPQRERTARASPAAAKFDYENWQPDQPTLNRIRQTDPDVTDRFIEQIRLEFVTYAEDNRYRENQMRSRFISRVHAKWIEAQQREGNRGPLRKAVGLQNVPVNELESWSRARDGPAPNPGESADDYRRRISEYVSKRERDEPGNNPVTEAARRIASSRS